MSHTSAALGEGSFPWARYGMAEGHVDSKLVTNAMEGRRRRSWYKAIDATSQGVEGTDANLNVKGLVGILKKWTR